ncbi:glycosyltransferase family 2 protein [Candidatus Azambacteria bacterium]|nr:glycosyltransferase family 2 protein [Candidatus Azambacteria bacterium]
MEDKKYPSVAIILLNWNGDEDTIECIKSVSKINYKNYKIFVVDNNSEKKSLEALRPFCVGGVELIENKENLGFSGGNNVGIEKALKNGFDYILLLNNDTTVEPDFLDELVKVAESDEKIGAVGSKIYFYFEPDRNKIWYGGGKFSWFGGGEHMQYGHIDADYPNDTKPREVDYITGCVFLIKSDIVKKIGVLPEEYFMYYEDVDWSLSVRKAGYKTMYSPKAVVYHKVTRSIKKIGSPRILYYHMRNALLLSKRHAPKPIYWGILMWGWYKYAKQLLKLVILPSKKEESKMIIKGIKDFYAGKFGKIRE